MRIFLRADIVGLAAWVGVGVSAAWLKAQSAPNDALRFEVASVKAAAPDARMTAMPNMQPGGRFVATNLPLTVLVASAFGLQRPDQMVGAPDWFRAARFDVVAKAGEEFASDPAVLARQAPAMIRALLEDRFALRVHTDSRDEPVYALVMRKAGGELGPQLRRSTIDCPKANAPVVLRADPTTRGCGFRLGSPGSIAGVGQRMEAIAGFLTGRVDRVILNRTELDGPFDFTLRWDPAATSGANGAASSTLPSIFVAIQEQLGLKLEATKGPVDVLVIDHVERPTDN